MIATAPSRIAATTEDIAGAFRQAELARAPRRLAQWRMRILDRLLEEMEELRLEDARLLPDELNAMIAAYGRAHDPALLEYLVDGPSRDVATAHDALFDAQGRVMLDLASFRSSAGWRELEEAA